MTIASAGNADSASAIANRGSASPTRPCACPPLRSRRSTKAAARSSARRRAASSSDTQRRSLEFNAGATTRTSASGISGGAPSRATMRTFISIPFWLLSSCLQRHRSAVPIPGLRNNRGRPVSLGPQGQRLRKEVDAMKKIDRMRFTRLLAVALLVLAAAVFSAGAAAVGPKGAVVKVGPSGLGRILVDAHGRTLYVWTHDSSSRSTCYGACARAWPPLVTRGKPRAVLGARSGLLGTSRRRDGRRQVTYRGHPIYRFAQDTRPGQTGGAGLTAFGGRWDPVSAAGIAVRGPVMFKRPKLKRGLLAVEGTRAGEKIALRLKAGDPGTLQVDVGDDGSADFSFRRKLIARIAVDARAGDDLVRMDESNGAFTTALPTTIDAGPGNDAVLGGMGAESLLGGEGSDTLDGNGGNDRALMGPGDDAFVWDPGDGSDVVEGEAGADTMRFNGANVAEQVELSANGNRLRFFRTQANITMDTAGVERVDFNALGGADLVTVDDLTGTDVASLNVDLGGDSASDRVVVGGTAANDAITVSGNASGVAVSGLRTSVAIQHQEPADELVVSGFGGNDVISAATLAAQAITLTLDGGLGDDAMAGSQGVGTLLGGEGSDTLDGNGGNDRALMGPGDDAFVWDPGDGSDVVEGEAGADTMRFNGANVAEQVELSASGNRL